MSEKACLALLFLPIACLIAKKLLLVGSSAAGMDKALEIPTRQGQGPSLKTYETLGTCGTRWIRDPDPLPCITHRIWCKVWSPEGLSSIVIEGLNCLNCLNSNVLPSAFFANMCVCVALPSQFCGLVTISFLELGCGNNSSTSAGLVMSDHQRRNVFGHFKTSKATLLLGVDAASKSLPELRTLLVKVKTVLESELFSSLVHRTAHTARCSSLQVTERMPA